MIESCPFDIKDESNSYPHQIDVHSVIDEEFGIGYIVYSSRYLRGKYKPKFSGYFADSLIDIYRQNKSLLDHPEIVQSFIENNNCILDYVHRHSKVIN